MKRDERYGWFQGELDLELLKEWEQLQRDLCAECGAHRRAHHEFVEKKNDE